MKSSLTYQLVLYLGAYYFFCYEVLELLLLLYKAILLPYPTGVLFSEVEFVSFELNSRGNVNYFAEEHESYEHVDNLSLSQVLFVLLLAVVEAARLLSGWKGNLTESPGAG